MSPEERAEDPVWRLVRDHDGPGEADVSDALDAFADRADQEPDSYRWSYARDLGTQARLVVVDSRAARVLDPEKRSLLDEGEFAWLDEQLRGDVDHLLIGTSLPYLLAPGPALRRGVQRGAGAWARGAGGWQAPGETIRQAVDLEHWAAFQDALPAGRAHGRSRSPRGGGGGRRARSRSCPATCTTATSSEAFARGRARRTAQGSRILQAVCSPIRNPLARKWRFATAFLSYGVAGPVGHVVARSAKVPDAPMRWRLIKGPWFDNNLATLEVVPDGLRIWWATGVVPGDDHEHPRLTTVADLHLVADGSPPEPPEPRRRAAVRAVREKVSKVRLSRRGGDGRWQRVAAAAGSPRYAGEPALPR